MKAPRLASAGVLAAGVAIFAYLGAHRTAFVGGILTAWETARQIYFWLWSIDFQPDSVAVRWRGHEKRFEFSQIRRAEILRVRVKPLLYLALSPRHTVRGDQLVRAGLPLGWDLRSFARRLFTFSPELLLQTSSGSWVLFPKGAASGRLWREFLMTLHSEAPDDVDLNNFRPDTERSKRAIELESAGNEAFRSKHWSEAVDSLSLAAEAWSGIGHFNAVKRCLYLLSESHLRLGNLGPAGGLLARALELAREIGDRQDVAHGLLQLGELNLRLGSREDLERCLECLDEALRIYREDRDRFMQSRILNNKAQAGEELYKITGDPDWRDRFKSDAVEALQLLPRRAGRGLESLHAMQKANIKGMLARVEFHLEKWREASALFAEAAALGESVGRGTFTEDEAMWGRALVKAAMGTAGMVLDGSACDVGLVKIDQAVRLSRNSGQFSELVDVLAIRADAYWDLAVLAPSVQDYETAVLLLEGRHHLFASQYERASLIRRYRGLYQRLVEGLLHLASTGEDPSGALRDQAFWYSELSKARTLSQQIGLADSLPRQATPDLRQDHRQAVRSLARARMNLEYLKRSGTASGAERLTAWKELRAATQRLREVSEEIQSLGPKSSAPVRSSPSLDELRRCLTDPEGAVLAFSIGETALCVFLVSHRVGFEKASFLIPGLGREGIENQFLKNGFLRAYDEYVALRGRPYSGYKSEQAHRRTIGALREEIERIRRLIFQAPLPTPNPTPTAPDRATQTTLEEILDGDAIRRLVIIPDGLLHRLPLQACLDRLEAVTLCPSSAALIHSIRHSQDRPRQALVVCNPAHGPDADSPSFAAEAAAVARALKRQGVSVRSLEGPEATVDGIVGGLANTSLFHFAGHGENDFATPADSHLKLAPDGARLTVGQLISEGSLSAGSWVVLSACETGISSTDPSGEYIGLPTAFITAGASLVVATLWEVHDATPVAIMVKFYDKLAGGTPGPVALAQTCREIASCSWSDFKNDPLLAASMAGLQTHFRWDLETTVPPSHPFHWAAFVAYGAPWTAAAPVHDQTEESGVPRIPTPLSPLGDGFPPRLSETGRELNRLIEAGNPEEAVRIGEEARREYGSKLLLDEQLAVAYSDAGDLEKAREAFKRVFEADPNSFRSHYNYGCLMRDWGHAVEARQAFREALTRNRWSAKVLQNLSETTNDISEALRLLARALEIEPDRSEIPKAMEILRELAALGPRDLAHHRLASAAKAFRKGLKSGSAERRRHWGYARLFLELALELRDNLAPETISHALAQLADLDRQRDDIEESIRLGESAAQLDPERPERWNTLAARRIILVSKGRSRNPEADLEAATRESGIAIQKGDYAKPHQNLSTASLHLAAIRRERRLFDTAKKEAQRAREMARRQNQNGPDGVLICVGCPTRGKVREECVKCLAATEDCLANIRYAEGDYQIGLPKDGESE